MDFFLFLFLVWAICLFHRREHKLFLQEISANPATLAESADWYLVDKKGDEQTLKRAFKAKTRQDKLRYALPLFFTAVILIVLHSWIFGFGYLAILGLKWFGSSLMINPVRRSYKITLLGQVLFAEKLQEL